MYVYVHSKITKPMKIFYQNLKINPSVQKIHIFINKWIQHVRRMDRVRLPHLIMKYQECGKQRQGRPLKGLLDC